MSVTHVVGIDPGLVHTGVVGLAFDSAARTITVYDGAINGLDATGVRVFINNYRGVPPVIFIEGYRPRSNLNSDKRMVEGVAAIRAATKGTVLLNTGVKKVVRKSLMELLGVWSFPTVTHHQDLRSAARIALLGMLKDDTMNRLIADIVRAHLRGRDWHVAH